MKVLIKTINEEFDELVKSRGKDKKPRKTRGKWYPFKDVNVENPIHKRDTEERERIWNEYVKYRMKYGKKK